MSKIFVTSDQHFFHEGIIKTYGRPFNNLEEMHSVLISNWNKVVKKSDFVFCVGDFSLGTKEETKEILSKLNGHKILILGEMDKMSKKVYLEIGFTSVLKDVNFNFKDIGIVQFTHNRIPNNRTSYFNVYGHSHTYTNNDDKHKSACVEVNNYTPVLLKDLITTK